MPHDVALVEALLCVVRRTNGRPYMTQYDGRSDTAERTAITSFQRDQGIVAQPGAGAAPPAAGGGIQDAAGVVNPFGPTINKLTQLTTGGVYQDLRVIAGTTTVYWPGEAADAAVSSTAIKADGGLDSAFRGHVAQLIDRMYANHKIVLSVTGSGTLRTFAEQYVLATVPRKDKNGKLFLATKAGPGESNHNFGMAVDLGFKGFKWLKANGVVAVADWWLRGVPGAKAAQLWKARNALASTLSLFPTSLAGDLIHLQNFNDANINMRNSLAQLLNLVGTMSWQVKGEIYSSDLGLGGAFYRLGKSEDVWGLKSSITAANLAAAQKAAGVPVQATNRDVSDMKVKLKADFELAEANRQRWVPVP
jgi:hypothetical protein